MRHDGGGQRSRLILVATIVAVVTAGCQPDWFLYARNASDEKVLLRVVYTRSDVEVFRLPAGFDGYLGGRGGQEDALVELLDVTCRLLESMTAPDTGAVQVTIDGLLRMTIEKTAIRSNDDAQRPEELRGECGSTKFVTAAPAT